MNKVSKEKLKDNEIVTVKDSNGDSLEIKYIKSFMAKLSQSDDKVKEYYNIIKKYALSYIGTSARCSWRFETINAGKELILRFAIRGKTLAIYYPLFEVDYKYKVEMIKSSRYENTPCLYRIKNDRRCEYAKQLIDIIMRKLHILKGYDCNKDFLIPYEDTSSLLASGLIRESKTKIVSNGKGIDAISVEEANEKMSDEEAIKYLSQTSNQEIEGKKCTVNIDTISENFNDGDIVDIESLLNKKIIPPSVKYVKVLAKGKLKTKLHLKLQEYSLPVIKMVILKGGSIEVIKR